MKYYCLYPSSDLDEIGRSPQSKEFPKMGKLADFTENGCEIKESDLPVTILHAKAKITTYMHIVRIPFIYFLAVNYKFIELLGKFKVGRFKFWELDVYHKEKHLDFHLFHLCDSVEVELLDFAKSHFEVGKIGDWRDTTTRKEVTINDYKTFVNLKEVLLSEDAKAQLSYKKLVIDLSNVELDIFRLSKLPGVGNGYYVSERLKRAMEENGFTGMAFKEIEQHYKKIKVIY